jgi:uncharacterized membrane protein YhaH (DUF805 family)
MFKSPFSFEGRISNKEYALTLLIDFGISVLLKLCKGVVPTLLLITITIIIFIPMIFFIAAQGTKRCHDMGESGWYQLIPFYCFLMLINEGDSGRNKYGEVPVK